MTKDQPNRSEESSSEPYFLVIGRVLRAHGVRGELRVRVAPGCDEVFEEVEEVFLGQDPNDRAGATQYKLLKSRYHQAFLLITLDGVTDRNGADLLRGHRVMVPLGDVPLGEGEIFTYQLYGLQVYSDAGEFLGELVQIIETGANDVFLLQGGERGEVLIPDTEEVVQDIDVGARTMTITPIPGLLPGDDE